jgi:hypothetical protein
MLQPSRKLPAFSLLLAFGAFVALIILLSSPSDSENAVFLGYSFERILLGTGVLIPGIALLFFALRLYRQSDLSLRLWADFTQRGRIGDPIFFLSLAAFFAGWILLLMPSYRLGGLAGYIQGLVPVIGWVTASGAVASVMILLERKNDSPNLNAQTRLILRASSIPFVFLALSFAFIAITGFGIIYPADYWYGAGVPLLGLQVMLCLLIGAVFLWIEHNTQWLTKKRIDAIIFIVIWLIAAWLWAREPLHPNYFMPDTADNVIYPYSDGATFDQGAQYLLIGQGLFNGRFFERPLYSIFLAYLHIAYGQDTELLMVVQAAVFAILPAVVYLIGMELHSRSFGITAGSLVALRGVNALVAAKWIDTASPKMMLTDFPTAVLISIFLLLFIKWLKDPSRLGLLAWMGAVFGFAIMVRTHAFALLPAVLVLIPFTLKARWKGFFLAGVLILLGLFAATLPWEIRNQSNGIPIYSSYYNRLVIILRHRYGLEGDAYVPKQDAVESHASAFSHGISRQKALMASTDSYCDSTICSIANHLVHNVVTSLVSLPSTLAFDDLWNTVKADTPYWKKSWGEGEVGATGAIMILVNLGLISLGVSSIWSRGRLLAVPPILIFFSYLLVNSLGITSGGRYVAPVDWIVCLYYIAGGMQLIAWGLRSVGYLLQEEQAAIQSAYFHAFPKGMVTRLFPAIAAILLVGSLLPLSEVFAEPRYEKRKSEAMLAVLESSGLLGDAGFTREELTVFLSQPGAMIREGRVLYPRYYRAGEGEPDRSTYYRFLEYQRLVFTLIGPNNPTPEGVVIPGDPPPFNFHVADAIVIGCWNTTYYSPFIDAVAVFVFSDEGYVYTRVPAAPLSCPLPEPR